ncbi:hypothetical protein STEG23_031562, partial [Scotinomys teguina]
MTRTSKLHGNGSIKTARHLEDKGWMTVGSVYRKSVSYCVRDECVRVKKLQKPIGEPGGQWTVGLVLGYASFTVESCVEPRLKDGAGFRLPPSGWRVLYYNNNSISGNSV